VDDLIFDKESLKVRYLILKVKKNKDLGLTESRKVLVPIGMAQLDREDDEVYLQNMNIDRLNSLPDYDKDKLNREMETRTYTSAAGTTAAVATGADFYNNDLYNDTNLYKNRRDRTSEKITDDTRNTDIDETKNRETTIPVIEENMNVGKKEVERGGIRIRQRVVEKPVEENINLREEHVKVDRKNVDRPATDRDFDQANDQDIEIREHTEVPVVNKEARVVEEIKVTKEVTNRDEKVKDTVRKTEVDVDDLRDKK
jgi:stress response protein YsnF